MTMKHPVWRRQSAGKEVVKTEREREKERDRQRRSLNKGLNLWSNECETGSEWLE